MYQDYKIVVNTAAGRRRYMQYLIPYVITCHIVDRYDIWVNTMDSQDIEFFKMVANKYPKINLVWQPDGVFNGNLSINAFYRNCVEEDTIYFKLDDDIIWMEDDLINKMIKFRVDNPDYFLVSPLVINNSLSTYLLQICNKIHLNKYYDSSCGHYILWRNGKFALELHNWFLDNYLVKNRVSDLYIGTHPMGMTRFSINAILWFGRDMKKFGGQVEGDDEEFLSCIYPTKNGLTNCWNCNAVLSHFAFFPQREQLDSWKILERYGSFIEKKWGDEKVNSSEVFSYIQEVFSYVELHKDEMPRPPYKSIIENQKKRKWESIIELLPHTLYLKYCAFRRNKVKYIIY